ncbi:hypothetical protein J1605_013027 [Eschrichtius robustus]|uniref:Uncharacterized protein n=1 Tax=Eschrichtius robustus TaxID=9764 RepID=A0AB34GHT1_ESCRO|nr:hypothetical protein J1605_013027 [Eschrichtius robustus]
MAKKKGPLPFAARHTKMKTATNIYIFNVALADTSVLLTLPFQGTDVLLRFWPFGNALRKTTSPRFPPPTLPPASSPAPASTPHRPDPASSLHPHLRPLPLSSPQSPPPPNPHQLGSVKSPGFPEAWFPRLRRRDAEPSSRGRCGPRETAPRGRAGWCRAGVRATSVSGVTVEGAAFSPGGIPGDVLLGTGRETLARLGVPVGFWLTQLRPPLLLCVHAPRIRASPRPSWGLSWGVGAQLLLSRSSQGAG